MWHTGSDLFGISSGGGFGTSNIVGTALWIRVPFSTVHELVIFKMIDTKCVLVVQVL